MQKSRQIIPYEWQKNLTILKQTFEKIKLKNKDITNSQIIKQLNVQLIKADTILIHEFLQNYSNAKQLLAVTTFPEVQTFFELLKSNYKDIQLKYLQKQHQKLQSTSNQQTDIISKDQEKQRIFERNKINLSKFIKDENQSFQNILNQNLQKIRGMEQEVGISANRVNRFIKSVFEKNSHIKIFRYQDIYFTLKTYEEEIKNIVIKYVKQVKQMPQNSFQFEEIYINEDEILDFITFWLQNSSNISTLHVIYTRTQQMMNQLEIQYRNSLLVSQNKVNQDITNNGIQDNNNQVKNERNLSKQIEKNKKFREQSQIDILNQVVSEKQLELKSILSKYKEIQNPEPNSKISLKPLIKPLSKEQKLEKVISQLFSFACKNRARTLKGTTFDQIQQQSRFMNLQKFINFCNHLDINLLIQREILIDEFKIHAINRLTLNVQQFFTLLKSIIAKDQKILNNLLNKEKLPFLKKKYHTKRLIQNHSNSLSKYNYTLRPVNGKTIESIQEDLKQKKQIKQFLKKQKDLLLLKKKQGIITKRHTILEIRPIKQKSTISESKLVLLNPNQISRKQFSRDELDQSEIFNPQSLISHKDGEEDKLWDEYEAKVWKRDKYQNPLVISQVQRNKSVNQSILQQALSKRIERGNKVLKKIVSSNIKYYQ